MIDLSGVCSTPYLFQASNARWAALKNRLRDVPSLSIGRGALRGEANPLFLIRLVARDLAAFFKETSKMPPFAVQRISLSARRHLSSPFFL